MAAEAAISSVVELLSNLLIEKVKSIRAVEGKVKSLKEELEWMQSFLIKANKKQAEDEGVREWIKKVREVAQDAEDTIEIFLINVENAKKNSRGRLLKRCTGFAKRIYHLDKIGGEIESIRSRLDTIDKSRERYDIKDLDEVAEPAWRLHVESLRRLDPWQKDEHLVGIEDDVEKLLRESILNEEKIGLSVAILQGMGGIGKSTLAREIYNHSSVVVSGRFDCRGWVTVSSEFREQETIKQLILELPGSNKGKIHELEGSTIDKLYLQRKLKEMLHEQLEGKSYFIVLDDVWEKEHLESLITAFPNQQGKRSRLLVTTRNKISIKNDQYVHKMNILDPDKSWGLFLKKLFIGEFPEELESIGRQIVEKCCGLPLAISVMAGLLVGTQSKSAWERVLKQINSYLGRAESSVSAILELSYQNLSPQLQSCFLCLAFFEEDVAISTKQLEYIWAAQGLIHDEESRRSDEIASGYINELINRSILQVVDRIFVEQYRLHDLVREVCIRKAKEEIGFEIVNETSSGSLYKSRHRVVYAKNLDFFSSNHNNKHIRSLFIVNVNNDGGVYMMTIPSHYWKSFRLLKILILKGFQLSRLPDSIQLLNGLKCLEIESTERFLGAVLELPIWLNQLKKLEILSVDYAVSFLNAALEMERMRHFTVSYVCGYYPMKIKNWKNIESLKCIRLKDWIDCSSTLMAGCHLRELYIDIDLIDPNYVNDEVISRARASLEKMANLVELCLALSISFTIEEIIPQLHSPTTLELKCWFDGILKCPTPSAFPPNLSHLTLINIDEVPMQELGKLPKLQYLMLNSIHLLDEEDSRIIKVLHDGFPCLETLSLIFLRDLECIDIEQGGMPHLKILKIRDCPHFKTHNLLKHIIVVSLLP